MKIKKKLILIPTVVLLLAVLIFVGIWIYSNSGKKKLIQGMSAVSQDNSYGENADGEAGIITYNGKKYRYNENLANILCMGVDVQGPLTVHEEWGNSGQSDFNALVSYDTVTGKIRLLALSRDTMTKIEHFSYDHVSNGWAVNHLALGYAMCDGGTESCKNMVNAVSRLLYGVPIQNYCALSIKKVADINDILGGVTVTVPNDDLAKPPYNMKKGEEITLRGEQVYKFIRVRDTTVDGSNNGRMERQSAYLSSLYKTAISKVKENPTIVLSILGGMQGYYYTSLDTDEILYLSQRLPSMQFSNSDIYTLPGTNNYDEAFDEFYVDDEKLYELVLQLFYEEIEE